MAKILGIYNTKDDLKFFEVTMLIDVVVVFVMAIILIAHTSIVGEGAATILAIFNIAYSAFGVYILLEFKKHKEVQRYENFIYAKSRMMWNAVLLIILVYLTIISGFWSFGKANRNDLKAILVFHILSLLYVLSAFALFDQMLKITNSQFSAVDGSNFTESNNYSEKISQPRQDRMSFKNLWSSDESYKGQKLGGKANKKEAYYQVPHEVEYIGGKNTQNQKIVQAHKDVNDTSNMSEDRLDEESIQNRRLHK